MYVPPDRIFPCRATIASFQNFEPTNRGDWPHPGTRRLLSERPGTVSSKWIVIRAVLAGRIPFGFGANPLRQAANHSPNKRSKPSGLPHKSPAQFVVKYGRRRPISLAIHELEGGVT